MVGEGRQIGEGRREIGGEVENGLEGGIERKRVGENFEVVVEVERNWTPTKVEIRVLDRGRS